MTQQIKKLNDRQGLVLQLPLPNQLKPGENEVVVGAAPTGDAPTTSDRPTSFLSTKVRLILEVWWYCCATPCSVSHLYDEQLIGDRLITHASKRNIIQCNDSIANSDWIIMLDNILFGGICVMIKNLPVSEYYQSAYWNNHNRIETRGLYTKTWCDIIHFLKFCIAPYSVPHYFDPITHNHNGLSLCII